MTGFASMARAQIDPESRELLQMGYNRQPDGRGPFSGYAYYYLNVPHFQHPDQTLRLVVAPGYVDSEVGFSNALGPQTDLGLGLAGGGFADSYTEIRKGEYLAGESFQGNGGNASINVYHHFPMVGPVPFAGILRAEEHYATYVSRDQTSPGFTVPLNQPEFIARAGLRLGGVEPVMIPELGMELSGWYEGRFRSDPSAYGYDGDRAIRSNSQLFWSRALLIYNREGKNPRFIAGITAGTSISADRFSAYRLGGDLPMGSEFPLPIPGYYYQEISAQRYVLVGGSYILPLSSDGSAWVARLNVDTAVVDYLPGLSQPGDSHTGVGTELTYQFKERAWQIMTEYGYGFNAIRGDRRGANSIGVFLQFNFHRVTLPFFHPGAPERGLEYLLRGGLPGLP